jgi:hypothetical protein
MFYVGLDIHTKHISICVLSEKGQLVHRAQVRTIEDVGADFLIDGGATAISAVGA